MTLLQTIIISKAGYDNGFENSHTLEGGSVALSSAKHPTCLSVSYLNRAFLVDFVQAAQTLSTELTREFPQSVKDNSFLCNNETQLHQFLRRTSALSRSLPSQAADEYESKVAVEVNKLPEHLRGTEVERLLRQRIGQDRYRKALLDYWDSACAVTGIKIPELLRASHAKPWSECVSDTERLDVYNGFLLIANLDALFDKFLISFTDDGQIILSEQLNVVSLDTIGISSELYLRRIDDSHLHYLRWHRAQCG